MGNTVSFKKEFGLILVGGIVFTASFLWKDLLSEIQEKYFPKGYGLIGRAIFTFMITAILIMVAVNLKGFFGLNSDRIKTPVEFDDSPINKNIIGVDNVHMAEDASAL